MENFVVERSRAEKTDLDVDESICRDAIHSSPEASPAPPGTSTSPIMGHQQHTRRLSLSTGPGKHPAPYCWSPRLKSSLFGAMIVAAVALFFELLMPRRESTAGAWTSEQTSGLPMLNCDTRLLCELVVFLVLLGCMCKVALEDRLALEVRRRLRFKLEGSFKHPSWVEAAWVRAGWETKVVVGAVQVSASPAATLAGGDGRGSGGGGSCDSGGCGDAGSALDTAGPTLLAVRNIVLFSWQASLSNIQQCCSLVDVLLIQN